MFVALTINLPIFSLSFFFIHMKLPFVLLNVLAGVNVCVAYNSSVIQLETSSNVRPTPPFNGRMPIVDEGEHGKSASAEEDRGLWDRRVTKWVPFLKQSKVRDDESLHEPLLLNFDRLTYEGKLAERTNQVNRLLAKLIRGRKDKGPHLMKLLDQLDQGKQFADVTLVAMLKRPETIGLVVNAWLASRKTPADALAFLTRQLQDGKWGDVMESNVLNPWKHLITSDLFSPWLTYVNAYLKTSKVSEKERDLALKYLNDLFFDERTMKDIALAIYHARLSKDGNEVLKIIANQAESANRHAAERLRGSPSFNPHVSSI